MHVWQDVRYALRSMRNSPGFTLAAVLTIALGIGANTAIFSFVDAVLLRMLPVERPEELVFLSSAGTEGRSGSPPYPCFERFRNEAKSFSGVAAFAQDELRIEVEGVPEQVFGQVASGSYFEVLGVKPVHGRVMTMADENLNPPVAVISYAYWQRRFGGDALVLGRTLAFRDRVFVIVGVTPRGFWGLRPGRQIDVTLPITFEKEMISDSGAWWFDSFARLKPAVPVSRAQAETNAIFQNFMADNQRGSSETRTKYFDHMELPSASQGLNLLRRQFSTPLLVLIAVVGAVLLIACANISNLLLARGAARYREFAIRQAIGAGRGRLIRQSLTETLLLFLLGAAVGLPLALAAVDGIAGFFAGGRQPVDLDIRLDWRLLFFTFSIALAAGLISGSVPALKALRMSSRPGRFGRHLIVGQVALSAVLLSAAAAFVQTLANLRNVHLGFRPAGILTMSIDPASAEILSRVRSLPGIRSASLSIFTPLSGRDRGGRVTVPGFQPRNANELSIHFNQVSNGYFETFGIDLVAGRTFTAQDEASAGKVVIINGTAARTYFRKRDPIGQAMNLSDGEYRVIGVVRDTRHMSVRDPAPRFAYLPIQPAGRVTLAVASALPESQLIPAITSEVRAVNLGVLVSEIVTMDQQIDSTIRSERLVSMLSSAFGLLALILSAVGLYGVISYNVQRRTQEIGLRMALGAQRSAVAWAVMRQTMALVGGGIALGLIAAVFATRAAQALLFGLSAADPLSYIFAAVVLTVLSALASYLPARRASSIDPMRASRHQ